MQPARHGQCCPHVLPPLGMNTDSLAGVSMGNSQEQNRRRGGGEEKGEEMKEKQEERWSRRRGGGEKERSTGQQLPPAPSQLTAGEKASVGL